jgi:dephospho-CoA kinase
MKKKHVKKNGKVLQTNKKWSHLKSGQREWIFEQVRILHQKYLDENQQLPRKDVKCELAEHISDLIAEKEIWLPESEIKKEVGAYIDRLNRNSFDDAPTAQDAKNPGTFRHRGHYIRKERIDNGSIRYVVYTQSGNVVLKPFKQLKLAREALDFQRLQRKIASIKKSTIFITGMSGSGKSTLLGELERKGYSVLDTDMHDLFTEVETAEGIDRIWDETKITEILECHKNGPLFIAGTVSNQGKFYPQFDEVVYLDVPLKTLLKRVANRTNNPYGKTEAEKQEIVSNYHLFDGLIKTGASQVLTNELDIQHLVKKVEALIPTDNAPKVSLDAIES